MNLQTFVSVPGNVMARRVGDEVIILDLNGGEYFGLPDVAGRIWELLDDGKSLLEAAGLIAAEFGVDRSTAENDLLRLVDELCGKGLLIEAPTGSVTAQT